MQLNEGTDVLFHASSIHASAQILASGNFELSSSVGAQSEEMWAKKGYPFFLSTSRSKVGDYHTTRIGDSVVVFNLDGRWLSQRYPVKPIDYWEGAWHHSYDRTSESEDRVLSKTPTIPITPVTAIHMLYKDSADPKWNFLARRIIIAAKKRKIPIYVYSDVQSFYTQDTRKAMPLSDVAKRLTGQESKSISRRTNDPYLTAWIELYHKDSIDSLSEKAIKLIKRINYAYSNNDDADLKNDLSNARKPGSYGRSEALKIIKLMDQLGTKTTVDLARYMKQKWSPLFAQRDKEERLAWHAAATNESVITEARQDSLILVDFQPAYQSENWGYDAAIDAAVEYINKYRPTVTAFFNGRDVGIEDSKEDVFWHYVEHGLDEELSYLFTFKEKSYAWLRSWMDNGVDPAVIIRVIRHLVMNNINDSRDIDQGVLKGIVGDEFSEWMIDDPLIIPDISIGKLKKLSGSLLGGGGKHECLKEIQLLMNAFNIRYTLVADWTYR